MTEENRFDPARLERIERRLQVLEDAEAIRNLKARYAALCDSQYDANGIAMFQPDWGLSRHQASRSPAGTAHIHPARSVVSVELR